MSNRTFQDNFEKLCQHVRENGLLDSISSVLSWDERTHMPPAAGPYRAEQMAYLAGELHRRKTDPRIGEWLAAIDGATELEDPRSDAGATVRWIRWDYEKRTKLPPDLAQEIARTCSLSEQTWAAARQNDDFAKFRPLLEKVIELKREQAAAYGYEDSPYDPLLDDYEPGATTANVARVLASLRDELVPLVQSISRSARRPASEILRREFPAGTQDAFCRRITEAIGYDYRGGGLAVTPHPFCATLGPADIRITTRYDEHFLNTALFGAMHEAGHALYEQGLRQDWFGLPPGQAASMGVHESQSRMWENQVGRSLAFWEYSYSDLQAAFPASLSEESLDAFHFAINDVQPSLIRVEADEVTYNLHILIRFELEQALIADDLTVGDLPDAWNEKYDDYLGVKPETYAEGCMQDVHWSAGLFGYFPTYALGNLYAAQFYEQAQTDLGDLDEGFRRGSFVPLLEWLRARIHESGHRFAGEELVAEVTGRPPSHRPLIDYLQARFAPLYAI